MRAANDFDPSSVDLDAFLKDVLALGEELKADLGPEDLAQLRTVERRGRAATALGLATCWLFPNPLSAAALSFGRSTRCLSARLRLAFLQSQNERTSGISAPQFGDSQRTVRAQR